MDTATLTRILAQEMVLYAVEMLNGQSYLTVSTDNRVFVVVGIDDQHTEYSGSAGLIVRIDDRANKIIIEHDMYDKPLVDALLNAQVPREQILLAYCGETIPETA